MISIIIIVKNDRGIENTLNSLENVEKPEKSETIIVDASEGNLDDISKKFPKVNWVYFHNKTNKKFTIPEQRNLGIKKARGEIIVFIDANCIPRNDWLIELTKPLIYEGEDIVAGITISKENSIYNNSFGNTKKSKYIEECPTINLALKKNVFKKNGNFDVNFNYGSDVDFCWRARNLGYKIRYTPKAVISHNWGNLKQDIKRAFRYGNARVTLYKKHPKKIKDILFYEKDLFSLYAILYFIYIILFIPATFFFVYYPLFLLISIIKNIKTEPIKKLMFDFSWGFGIFKELFFPKKIKFKKTTYARLQR
ncbi:glycosyltransferase [Candidatus Pacearchaeota archaeon]|nr:glycosyltransferase [Candidatus Pacearchaeota archaeon]